MGFQVVTQSGKYQTNELGSLFLPAGSSVTNLANRRCVILIHGRTGYAASWEKWYGGLAHIRALVNAGYVVYSIDAGACSTGAGTAEATRYRNPWGSDDAMTAITAARTYLITTLGASGSTKVFFYDYSAGGGQGFNWMSRNAGLCAGAISMAPATDFDYAYTNQPVWNCELEVSYATVRTSTTGTGTLNQVGSNLTITSGAGFPASGVAVLYPWGKQLDVFANDPVRVTYTGGGGTTTLTGCTVASGSYVWGTGGNGFYKGVCLAGTISSGAYATAKPTRSPLLIASNVVFDSVPVHNWCGTLDEYVGAAATPASTQVPDFIAAVNAAQGSTPAVYHSVAGKNHAGVFAGVSTDEILTVVNAGAW